LELVEKAKNLGVTINNKLNFKDHIYTTIGKVYGMLRCLWASQHFTPQRIRLLLAKTYFIPKLLFGCELFANMDSDCRQKMNVVFNNIARYVFSKKRFESISSFSKKLCDISFDSLLHLRSLVQIHKIIYTKEPAYLYDKLRFLRSERSKSIAQYRYNNLLSERHFFVHAVRLWNSLPKELHFISNTFNFKTKLKDYLNRPQDR